MIMLLEGNDSDGDGTLQTNDGKDLDSIKSATSAEIIEPSTAVGTTVSSTPSTTFMKKGTCTC